MRCAFKCCERVATFLATKELSPEVVLYYRDSMPRRQYETPVGNKIYLLRLQPIAIP